MSRAYAMYVRIVGFDPKRKDEIIEAAKSEWNFDDDWSEHKDEITCNGESSLCGGESEEQFTQRLSTAIWKANKKFCTVEVNATCMEDLPCECHTLCEETYMRLKRNGSLDEEKENEDVE